MLKLLLLAFSVNCAFSANILYIAPMASPSHYIWNRALALGLVAKGHNVTLIGPDSDKKKVDNYTTIQLEGVYEEVLKQIPMNDISKLNPLGMLNIFQTFSTLYCEVSAKSQGLQKLLSYPDNFFDLVVFDYTGGGCFLALIQKFNYPPTVAVTPLILPPHIANNFGNHLYPAYIPFYAVVYTNKMNFIERVFNFVYNYVDVIIRLPKNQKHIDDIMKKVLGENAATIEELEHRISLILSNTDPVLYFPQPLAPNIIPVGGLHTGPAKKLPKDLQAVADNAKNGIIVFSLGTNVRSDKLDQKTRQALLDAFSKLEETVIWKFESDIEDLPKNVIVRKFLPQNDILGHPNTKLFIGHGGTLSTQEAVFHGVPIIAVPFFMDQRTNAKIINEKKLGTELEFTKITSDYVYQKIRQVLDDPEYTKNMKRHSQTFRDRLETPLERGVFWVEYVLRHGGASFLSTPARHLPFYVSSSLDVIAFLLLIVILIVIVIIKIVSFILKMIVGEKKIKTN